MKKIKVSLDPSMPGMHHGVAFNDYLKIDAVSKSILWKMDQTSPAELQYWLKNPGEPTDAMLLGSMVDCRICEGMQAFNDKFCRIPPDMRRDRRTKKYQDFLKLCGKKTPVPHKLFDRVEIMRDQIMGYPLAEKRIVDSVRQLTLVWENDGVLMKGRPDFATWINDESELVDLKVTNSIKLERFAKTAHQFGYYWQAAIYLDGLSTLQGFGCNQFSFIIVKDSPPFGVEVVKLTQSAIELGRREYLTALEKWRHCHESDDWPASSGQLQVIDLPIYAYPRKDAENV